MNIEHMHAAFNTELDLTASEWATFVALAWFENKESGRCDPAQKTIAAKTRLSRATIQRAVAGLIEKGLVERITARAGGKKRNSYQLKTSITVMHDAEGQASQRGLTKHHSDALNMKGKCGNGSPEPAPVSISEEPTREHPWASVSMAGVIEMFGSDPYEGQFLDIPCPTDEAEPYPGAQYFFLECGDWYAEHLKTPGVSDVDVYRSFERFEAYCGGKKSKNWWGEWLDWLKQDGVDEDFLTAEACKAFKISAATIDGTEWQRFKTWREKNRGRVFSEKRRACEQSSDSPLRDSAASCEHHPDGEQEHSDSRSLEGKGYLAGW